MLIARHHDRLTRNPDDFARLMHVCGKAKIKISLYTGGELDLSTASGGFYGFMETGRAWYESAIRSQRVKDAVERNARAGKRSGGRSRPFGYKIIRHDLGEGVKRRYRIIGEEIEPAEAEAIRGGCTSAARREHPQHRLRLQRSRHQASRRRKVGRVDAASRAGLAEDRRACVSTTAKWSARPCGPRSSTAPLMIGWFGCLDDPSRRRENLGRPPRAPAGRSGLLRVVRREDDDRDRSEAGSRIRLPKG